MTTTGDTRKDPTTGSSHIAITGSQTHAQLQHVAHRQPVDQTEV